MAEYTGNGGEDDNIARAELPPSQICPDGTKVWMMCLGYLECDEAFLIRGVNCSKLSTKDEAFVNKRRKIPMYSLLISHPHEGLILWEVGSSKHYPEQLGPVVHDVLYVWPTSLTARVTDAERIRLFYFYDSASARVEYNPEHHLEAAVTATGHRLEDVKHIILGHLHMDHAGGLELFKGSKIPVWVHELELKAAFYGVATGADDQVYLKDYLDLDLNWRVFDERTVEFAQGMILHHLPGHTEGLMGLQLNLPNSGTWIFTSDLYHVRENYLDGITQGWLARDHKAWFTSHHRIKRLQHRHNARVIMGHDPVVCAQVWDEQKGAPLT